MKDLYIASCDVNGGIYHYKTDFDKKLIFCEKTKLDRPMYLAVSDKKLYALLRAPFNSDNSGMITFDLNEDGALINQSDIISTKGLVACHIWVEGKEAYAVNYLSGSVIKFPEKTVCHEGHGINPVRQEEPHTHFVRVTPDKKYVCAVDLGLDTVFFYDRDLNFKFKVKVPEGYGARHLEFSKDGRYIYCVNELKSSVCVFEYNGDKTKLLNTYSALPENFKGDNLAAAIRIRGDYLYVSNRGHDSVAVFKIDGGRLEISDFIKVGREPRDFNIFEDNLVAAAMADNKVSFYKIKDNGGLVKSDLEISDISTPLCIV